MPVPEPQHFLVYNARKQLKTHDSLWKVVPHLFFVMPMLAQDFHLWPEGFSFRSLLSCLDRIRNSIGPEQPQGKHGAFGQRKNRQGS